MFTHARSVPWPGIQARTREVGLAGEGEGERECRSLCFHRFLDQRSGDAVLGVKSWIQPHTAHSKWAKTAEDSGAAAVGITGNHHTGVSHIFTYIQIKDGE